jgi:CheY-like chemotaxis protein
MFKILIVEDNSTYRELLKVIVDEGKFPGVIVEEPQNVKQAIEKADSFRALILSLWILDCPMNRPPIDEQDQGKISQC